MLTVAFLALGVAVTTIGSLRAPAPEAARHAMDEHDLAGKPQQTIHLLAAGSAQLPVGIPAVAAPGRVTAVGLTAMSPVDWDNKKDIETVDRDPAGKLQWDPETGRVRVCDIEPDGHLVRGEVSRSGTVVARMRAGEDGKCDEASIADYRPTKKVNYKFQVCLAMSDSDPDGFCNTSSAAKWPEAKRKEGYCSTLSGQDAVDCTGGEDPCDLIKGDAKDYCERGGGGGDSGELFSTEKPDVPKPPKWRHPSVEDSPDANLRAHAKNRPSEIDRSVRKILGWLIWTTLGACVAGIMTVGARMAIKHRRGEAGEHAAELGWVLIACIVVGSGAAAFVSILFGPL